MKWDDIRRHYPHQWLLVEALQAHSAPGHRIVEDLAVLESFQEAGAAMQGYKELHRREPHRELYVLHTDREQLDIAESYWLGIRAAS